jgi:radical SAM protein with 4Fe4S-binding SPASM domain
MIKKYYSESYNYIFNTENGFMARWGRTSEEDPDFSPVGPEIADIEISTICNGFGTPCSFCYKSNGPIGKYMPIDLYKTVLSKLKNNLTQVALGIGDLDSNPDLEEILSFTRKEEIVPNITINGYGMSAKHYVILSRYCGAVAVSNYDLKNCLEVIKELKDKKIKQVNMHQVLCEETFEDCLSLLASHNDKKPYNAIVFLSLKQKGRGNKYTPLSQYKFNKLLKLSLENHIPIGFDSCSANKVFNFIGERYPQIKVLCEPCESMLFSIYVNVDGIVYPCSFLEGETEGIQITKNTDLIKDIWENEKIIEFRQNLIKNGRNCPVWKI